MTDIATRVYNHTWKIDPIVRSVLDTDFYKLLMAQTIFRRHRHTHVTFGIINRSKNVPLARLIDRGALKEQLDHIRTLGLSRGESTWLRGNMFYGKRQFASLHNVSSAALAANSRGLPAKQGAGDGAMISHRGAANAGAGCVRGEGLGHINAVKACKCRAIGWGVAWVENPPYLFSSIFNPSPTIKNVLTFSGLTFFLNCQTPKRCSKK